MKALLNKKFILEKFHGKGGWTFARIPKVLMQSNKAFGWVKVRGSIDGFEISKYHLMAMDKENLFLPVKAEIRKKIKKFEGDEVHVILYPDTEPLEIPEELLLCLADEPQALQFFNGLSESEKKYYIQFIFSAKKDETKINRMAKSIQRMLRGLKLYQPENDKL